MNRRDFLKLAMQGSVLMSGTASLGWPLRGLAAWEGPVPRTLVNVTLNGGIDWRFAFVPTPDYDQEYVSQFWASRKGIYRAGYTEYATMYQNEYLTVQPPGSQTPFGIHKSCGWLASRFQEGRVAIVANTFGSTNRDHDHSVLIMNTGDPSVSAFNKDRNGWGGRLVEWTAGSTNVVSISPQVSILAFGSDPANRLARVVHGKDMRNMALPPIDAYPATDARSVTRRALFAYYKQRGLEVPAEKDADWPYHKFFQQFDKINNYGGNIRDRLSGNPLPTELANLNLADDSFEKQCENLYDCCQTADYLDFRLIEMYYSGFDTHATEEATLITKLNDILGTGGGLDIATQHIALGNADAIANLTFVFSSDFGRQLVPNGTWGTDHGSGTYTVLIGDQVNGGTYGEMFPLRESQMVGGKSPLTTHGTDIMGLTSFERVYARACDWVAPNSGNNVFPNAPSSAAELDGAGNPIDLSALFVS